uniref:Ig-like domain-containing protein n=1 Tax=Neogobius melanostomus TaxID=47308 RepID=A0A8C6TS77_9GOBI
MESALCTLLSALVVLLCSSPECKGEDTVTQPEGDASEFKGDTATINCTFETSDPTPTLFWYKQEGHGFDESRFKCEADLKENSVYLKIQDVRVSDSAVYYCALQPTVTGNTKTLNKNLWRGNCKVLLFHKHRSCFSKGYLSVEIHIVTQQEPQKGSFTLTICKSSLRQCTVMFRAVQEWNDLPQYTKEQNTGYSFKKLLSLYYNSGT